MAVIRTAPKGTILPVSGVYQPILEICRDIAVCAPIAIVPMLGQGASMLQVGANMFCVHIILTKQTDG